MFFSTKRPCPIRSWLHDGAFLNHRLKSVASDISHGLYNSSASLPLCFVSFFKVNCQPLKIFLDLEFIGTVHFKPLFC